jgi:hypothetical protein
MAAKSRAVYGIYPSAEAAERAVEALIAAGFARADISVLLCENMSPPNMSDRRDTRAPEGATAGATAGGIIGGTIGVLAGVGALAIPAVGFLMGAGPIVAGLAGLGLGGAVGGLVGALIGLAIREYEAGGTEGRLGDGGTLLSVHCETPDAVKRAKELLKATWAQEIASRRDGAAKESKTAPV